MVRNKRKKLIKRVKRENMLNNSNLGPIKLVPFKEIDLSDSFFDSLKSDYPGFEKWFDKKASNDEKAFVLYNKEQKHRLDAFLYLKFENTPIDDIEPKILEGPVLKIGTFKVNPHKTRLGERFLKIAIDTAFNNKECKGIYVTAFEKHSKLIEVFKTFGFYEWGTKPLTGEKVYYKPLEVNWNDDIKDYPIIDLTKDRKFYVLSIYPEYHTLLFPDSKLNTEDEEEFIQDVSYTNGIFKRYVGKMYGLGNIKPGDVLLIYRTKDEKAKTAKYNSVLTSMCIVIKTKNIMEFKTFEEFKNYMNVYNPLTDEELKIYYYYPSGYRRHNSYIIDMLYNVPLKKRLVFKYIHGKFFPTVNIPDKYWGFYDLTKEQVLKIIEDSQTNKRYFKFK